MEHFLQLFGLTNLKCYRKSKEESIISASFTLGNACLQK